MRVCGGGRGGRRRGSWIGQACRQQSHMASFTAARERHTLAAKASTAKCKVQLLVTRNGPRDGTGRQARPIMVTQWNPLTRCYCNIRPSATPPRPASTLHRYTSSRPTLSLPSSGEPCQVRHPRTPSNPSPAETAATPATTSSLAACLVSSWQRWPPEDDLSHRC